MKGGGIYGVPRPIFMNFGPQVSTTPFQKQKKVLAHLYKFQKKSLPHFSEIKKVHTPLSNFKKSPDPLLNFKANLEFR